MLLKKKKRLIKIYKPQPVRKERQQNVSYPYRKYIKQTKLTSDTKYTPKKSFRTMMIFSQSKVWPQMIIYGRFTFSKKVFCIIL